VYQALAEEVVATSADFEGQLAATVLNESGSDDSALVTFESRDVLTAPPLILLTTMTFLIMRAVTHLTRRGDAVEAGRRGLAVGSRAWRRRSTSQS
jgi:hypothetical protein